MHAELHACSDFLIVIFMKPSYVFTKGPKSSSHSSRRAKGKLRSCSASLVTRPTNAPTKYRSSHTRTFTVRTVNVAREYVF